ncbi:MAG: hypothetical protein M1820_002475 [Bogoriella megaspora]|nr:MAG: hypothetical protein M1820_002475 [Bogoriella megaspora]
MATDFISLPLPVIWRLNMLRSQKLSLTMITSLAIVTIAFDTVRTVKLFQLDSRLTDLYSTLELHIAVLISILPTYRFLVSNTDRNREYQRLFWSRITFGSVGSGRSYSMHSMPNHSGQSSEGLAPGAAGPQSGIEQTRTISVVREPVAKKVNT